MSLIEPSGGEESRVESSEDSSEYNSMGDEGSKGTTLLGNLGDGSNDVERT